ncbi:TIGR03557 family F420-dependent LLM class oxidoreductase [Nocardia yamanashiensis]|uniref:TIGR03557 family F420-dependent LLM class oxidoreductase n=1 Tax=Nocardia yamanashiensis TaxID=209247 RepID=UPI001E61D9F8|nr:TIGR03557 family F420-dependent LLM class oxidoreductase [Nocardia yamanashiensis]UGT43546.1 TIGR03557 family F420-dependent LLM class oxidoreductase [Nocardia yamanashiensis]
MTRFGYTLMTEQSGPRELVGYAVAAEQAGFDFLVSSDHFSPWLEEQGHAPHAWTMLGAVAQATDSIPLMTYVTCPTLRYHPVIVAQQAATLQILAEGRFTLGLGSGESLNEHVVGMGWPGVAERHERLEEAIGIIRDLLAGGTVNRHGHWYRVDSARIWDLPPDPVPLAVAVSGARSVERFAPLADEMISTDPDADLVQSWRQASDGDGAVRVTGQVPVSWDTHRDKAVQRAHEQFRWSTGGWDVNSNLPTTDGFAAATQLVRPEDVADSIPCGPDLDAVVEAVRPYWEAGFTDIALVQVGDEAQQQFLDEAAGPLLEKLRAAAA